MVRVLLGQWNLGRCGQVDYGIELVLDLEVSGEFRAWQHLGEALDVPGSQLDQLGLVCEPLIEKPSCLDIVETLVVRREVGDDGNLPILAGPTSRTDSGCTGARSARFPLR